MCSVQPPAFVPSVLRHRKSCCTSMRLRQISWQSLSAWWRQSGGVLCAKRKMAPDGPGKANPCHASYLPLGHRWCTSRCLDDLGLAFSFPHMSTLPYWRSWNVLVFVSIMIFVLQYPAVRRCVSVSSVKWVTSCLHEVDIVCPFGSVLGEIAGCKLAVEGLLCAIELSTAAVRVVDDVVAGKFTWPSEDRTAAELEPHESKAIVAPVEGWCVQDFPKSNAGFKNIQEFMMQLPRLWSDSGKDILDDQQRVKVGPKLEKWSVLCSRTADYFCTVLGNATSRTFAQTVLTTFLGLTPANGSQQQLQKFLAKVDHVAAPFICAPILK